jgi:hypothetical protein
MRKRTLFVLNSEWTRLRRTGLGDLGRIPRVLNGEGCSSPWAEAYLIVPRYSALLHESLADHVKTMGAIILLVSFPLHPATMRRHED